MHQACPNFCQNTLFTHFFPTWFRSVLQYEETLNQGDLRINLTQLPNCHNVLPSNLTHPECVVLSHAHHISLIVKEQSIISIRLRQKTNNQPDEQQMLLQVPWSESLPLIRVAATLNRNRVRNSPVLKCMMD